MKKFSYKYKKFQAPNRMNGKNESAWGRVRPNMEVRDLVPGAFLGYKCSSFTAYKPSLVMPQSAEWDGLYISPNADVAKGYGPDYASDSGDGQCFLFKVYVNNSLTLLKYNNLTMANSDISGHAKAMLCKSEFGLSTSGYFMHALGRKNTVFSCRHDEKGNYEIILPNALASCVSMRLSEVGLIKDFEVKWRKLQ